MSLLTVCVLSLLSAPPCTFQAKAMEWSACVMPPMECPNGAFTGVQECAGGQASHGCPPRRTTIGWAIGVDTGRREVVRSCGSRFSAVFARCQCSGNLLGFCLGPCRPVGGLIRMVPCPGAFSTVETCPRPTVHPRAKE